MIRVYLDKNIYSYLKNANNPIGVKLSEKIQTLKPYIVIPFSRAHLSDLSNDYDKQDEEKRIKTAMDLELIAQVTEGNCIASFFKDKAPRPTIVDPAFFFEQVVEEKKTKTIDHILSLETLFDEDEGDENFRALNSLWKSYINLLKTLPIGIDFTAMENTPEGEVFLSMFPRARYSNTLWDMMCDLAELIDSMDTNPQRYIQLRNMVKSGLKVGTHISNLDIHQLDKYFLGTALKKTFSDFVEDTVKASKKDETDVTYEDRFLTTFSNLDIIGFRPDEFKKGYSNFFNDIQHAFYGAHCDYFITNDKQTLEKAKLIYQKDAINTKALTPEQFLKELESLTFKLSLEEFINEISTVLKKGAKTAVCNIETHQEIYFHYCSPYFLNFFNYMESYHYPDGKVVYLFSKKSENYSNMVFYREIQNLVDHLVDIFGTDNDNRGKFDPNVEHTLINDRTWNRRKWGIGVLTIILCRLEDELYPSLYVGKLPQPELKENRA